MKHIKSLDALRGIAVLAVIAHHTFYLPVGWVGVQLFFVLSGFLITGILLRVKDTTPSFNSFLSRFFWRRTLRIWPLYYLHIALFALLLWIIPGILSAHPPAEHVWLARSPLAFSQQPWAYLATFTLNLHPRVHYALGHLWTLSVEEQFYIAWPFIVYFLSLNNFRRVLLGLLLFSPLFRYVIGLRLHVPADVIPTTGAIYSSTWSHLDAFASGALLTVLPAALHEKLKARAPALLFGLSGLTALGGLAVLIGIRARSLEQLLTFGYPILLTPHLHQYVWGYTLLNLSSAALIFYLVNRASAPKFFENRFLVYTGKISFGVYVWHMLLLFTLWHIWPDWPIHRLNVLSLGRFALYLTAVIGLASASYFGFEQLFLRLKDRVAPERKAAPVET